MKRIKLDKIDLNILKNLQENGRITNVELAKSAGISAPPCLRRVRALEESGYIKGYSAHLDQSLLGYNITVFAMVNLNSQADKQLSEFEDYIRKEEQVRECFMLAGETDFFLKIVAKDWDAYQEFLTKKLTTAPNVVSVKSQLAIKNTKNLPGIPMD